MVRDLAPFHPTVRRLKEAVLVGAGVGRQGIDETDVRPFRGFDGAHATVVRRVHVPNLEACPLSGQTAGTQGGNATLVGHFRQRVILIHELGELGRPKELLHRSRHGLRVDHVLGHEAF